MKKSTLRFMSVALSAATAFTFAGFSAPTTTKAAETAVAINEANFPDEYFRNAVSTNLDTNKNGSLDPEEAAVVTDFTVYNYGWGEDDPYFYVDEYGGYLSLYNCSNCTGIEYFTNASYVYLYSINDTKFDFSGMSNLSWLTIDWAYNLESVDVTGLEELYSITITHCDSIKSLDVSTNKNINYVSCAGNANFSTFKTGNNNKSLSSVYVYGPSVKSLDLSKLSALTDLAINDCNLNINKLGIKNKNKITTLCINNNKKSGFVPSEFKNLTYLEYENNGAKSIDLSKNKKLSYVDVRDNSLKKIDVSKQKDLWFLDVSNNKLSSIDVSKNKDLGTLYATGNVFKKLDLTKNKYLGSLYINYNPLLTTIDASKCTSLYYVSIDYDATMKLPSGTYTYSYYDYSKEDTVKKKLKGSSVNGEKLDLKGEYVTFVNKKKAELYIYFSYMYW